MFTRKLSTILARLFGDDDGVEDPSDLDRETVVQRLHEFECERREIREELESLQARYERAVAMAERFDESALDVVRGDLSRVIEAAAVARARGRRATLRHRVLQLLASLDRSPRSLTSLDVDLDHEVPGVRAPLWVAPGHLDPPPVGIDYPSDCGDPVYRVRAQLGDVDARVDDVATAARTDTAVPTLRALLEAKGGGDYDEHLRDRGGERGEEWGRWGAGSRSRVASGGPRVVEGPDAERRKVRGERAHDEER